MAKKKPTLKTLERKDTTLTLLGEKVKIDFNLQTILGYEEFFEGETFSPSDLITTKKRVALYLACIMANNPDSQITYDSFVKGITIDELNALDRAVGLSMAKYYHMPEPLIKKLEEEQANLTQEEKEKQQQNA